MKLQFFECLNRSKRVWMEVARYLHVNYIFAYERAILNTFFLTFPRILFLIVFIPSIATSVPATVFCFSRDDIAYRGDMSRRARGVDGNAVRGKEGCELSTTQMKLRGFTLSHIKSNLYDYCLVSSMHLNQISHAASTTLEN